MSEPLTVDGLKNTLKKLESDFAINVGFISNVLFANQETLELDTQTILDVVTACAKIRDDIYVRVDEIRNVIERKPPNGTEPNY